jgi:hypothetical protein
MIGKSVYKIPAGKLVKISLDFEENKINSVKINGDFFLHPEKGIELIEKGMEGKELQKEKIINCINRVAESNSLQLFGINAEGLADAILMAKEKGEKND